MKRVKMFFIVSFLFSCSFNEKHIIKEIKKEDITVQWYYIDQFRERSSDFVDIIYDNQTINIYKASDVVTDIIIKDHYITIMLFEPHRGIVYTKKVNSKIFGYKIILDSTATYEEYLNKEEAK